MERGGGEYRRGRNWHTATGAMFVVMAGIVLVRQLLIWGPEFMAELLLNSDITNEKVSAGMLGFGALMIAAGLRKGREPPPWRATGRGRGT